MATSSWLYQIVAISTLKGLRYPNTQWWEQPVFDARTRISRFHCQISGVTFIHLIEYDGDDRLLLLIRFVCLVLLLLHRRHSQRTFAFVEESYPNVYFRTWLCFRLFTLWKFILSIRESWLLISVCGLFQWFFNIWVCIFFTRFSWLNTHQPNKRRCAMFLCKIVCVSCN